MAIFIPVYPLRPRSRGEELLWSLVNLAEELNSIFKLFDQLKTWGSRNCDPLGTRLPANLLPRDIGDRHAENAAYLKCCTEDEEALERLERKFDVPPCKGWKGKVFLGMW